MCTVHIFTVRFSAFTTNSLIFIFTTASEIDMKRKIESENSIPPHRGLNRTKQILSVKSKENSNNKRGKMAGNKRDDARAALSRLNFYSAKTSITLSLSVSSLVTAFPCRLDRSPLPHPRLRRCRYCSYTWYIDVDAGIHQPNFQLSAMKRS